MTEAKLRAPKWRQDPARSTRTLESRGRVECPGCKAKGCALCNSRGWMIDESKIQEEWDG